MLWRRVFSDISAWLTGLVSLLAASVSLGISAGWFIYRNNLSNGVIMGAYACALAGVAFLLLVRSKQAWLERRGRSLRFVLAVAFVLWLLLVMKIFQSRVFLNMFGTWMQEVVLWMLPFVALGFLASYIFPGFAWRGAKAKTKSPSIREELWSIERAQGKHSKGWRGLVRTTFMFLPLVFLWGTVLTQSLPSEHGYLLVKYLGIAYAIWIFTLLRWVYRTRPTRTQEGRVLRFRTHLFMWTATLFYLLSPFVLRLASTIVWVSNFVTENPIETREFPVVGPASQRSKLTCVTPLKVQLVPDTKTGIVCVGETLQAAAKPGQTLIVRGEEGPLGMTPHHFGLLP